MCEKAGTVARAGTGDAAWLGAVGRAVVAAGVGAGGGTRPASWAWWSSKSRPDSAARGRVRLVDGAGTCPSTRAIGTASTAGTPTTTMTLRRLSNLMTRLTRSGHGVLRIARCVTQRGPESIWPVHTLYRSRRAMMTPLNAELAARAWEFAQGLDLEEYRRLQGEVRNAWPATAKLNGLDFDRAFLAFIAERWLDKTA